MAKKIPYFKDLESSNEEIPVVQNEPIIHNDDMLSIVVSAMDPIAVAPFNLPIISYTSPGEEKLNTTPTMQPYVVDVNGEINFPILGKIKIGGLKKSEAVALIKEKLQPYLKDPIITIQFLNYKITILGEVQRPGTYTISNEHTSILQALGIAGDLTVYGRRDNVLLIREKEGGKKEYIRIDLTQTDILSSPFYYLQQNDVIYVEPNKTRINTIISSSASTNAAIYLSTLSSLASVATTIIAVINMNKE
jgi:polysaccharide export outer membrane protein